MLNEQQRKELEDLKNMTDEDIDLSDIPEILDWTNAKRGMFYNMNEVNQKLPKTGILHNSVMLRKVLDRNSKIGDMDKSHVLALFDEALSEAYGIGTVNAVGDYKDTGIAMLNGKMVKLKTEESIWKHLDNMGNVIS